MSDIDPFEYDQYRPILRAWLAAQPSRSQTALARRVGVSRSLVAMVLAHERDISLTAATKWSDALGLVEDGRAYFLLLVKADSPISLELRRQARAQASAIRESYYALRPTLNQARLLSRWYVPVILELARSKDFRIDAEWLASAIWPRVDSQEVAETLRALVAQRVLTDRDGAIRVDPRPISTDAELSAELTRLGRTYHALQLDHAARALEEQPREARWFGSLAVAIDGERLPELREALHRFQLEVIEPFRAAEGGDKVVQISLQLFQRTP